MSKWSPNPVTRKEIDWLVEDLFSVTPEVLGVDETITGCEVIDLNPYGVGLDVLPRYILVSLRGRYHQDVFYRGGLPDLAVGDYLTVIHSREGNRYEVMGPGGAAGVIPDPAPVDAEYVVMTLDGTLTNERVLVARQWLGLTDGGAGGDVTLDFTPDNPARVQATGVITEYATIQAAINASVNGDWVAVPPGTYVEALTLKDGVPVTELFRHTVTIRQTTGTYTVQTAGTGTFLICVHRIEMDQALDTNSGIFAVYANHTSGVFTIIADLYCRNSITAANGAALGLGNWNTGDVNFTGDIECRSTGYFYGCYAARNDSTGTLLGYGDIYTDATDGFAYALRNDSTGSLRWWGDLNVDTWGVDPARHFAIGIRTRGGTTEWHGRMDVHADWTEAKGLYASNGAGTVYLNGHIEVWGYDGTTYGIFMGAGAACTSIVTFRGTMNVMGYNQHAYGTHTDATYGDGTIWLHADIHVDGISTTRGVSNEGSGTTWHQDGGIDTINGGPIHDLYQSAGTLNVSNSRYDRGKTFGTITEKDGDKVGHHKLASVAVNEGASLVGIQDVGAFYVATDVEGALQEIGAIAPVGGAGSGAVNRIAYWSDANTITSDAGLTYNAATDSLIIAGNILMADDKFVGITGDIRIEFDSSDGDIMFHLGDAAGADEVQVLDSGSNVVAYIDSDGNTKLNGHLAVGVQGWEAADIIMTLAEQSTIVAGGFWGCYYKVNYDPGANFAANVIGMQSIVELDSNFAQTGGTLYGLRGEVTVANGATATGVMITGFSGFVDVEDASATFATSALFATPYVDTGLCTDGYGVRINQGTVGAGSITTLYGLRISAITAGNTNYAIYSAGGNSYHAGRVAIGGTVAAVAVLHVDQSSPTAGIPVLKLDQGDISEQCILFSSDAADRDINLFTIDVTGVPKFWWDESENALVYTCPNSGAEVSLVIQNAATGAGTIASLRFIDTTAVSDYGKIAVERIAVGHSTMRFYTLQASALVETFTLTNSGRAGVRTPVPLAELHVDQPSNTAAIPVLYLDQADVSEPFTNYVGTSAASAANSLSSWTTGNAVQGHIQIDVNGVRRWLRFYDDPTS